MKKTNEKQIVDGFRLLGLENEVQRKALIPEVEFSIRQKQQWGELVTRSNAERSEQLERFSAQLQPNFK